MRLLNLKLTALAALAASAVLACSTSPAEDSDEETVDEGALVDVAVADESPDVLIKDARTLTKLEDRFGLAKMLRGSGVTVKELHDASPIYRDVVASVAETVNALKARDKSSGVGTAFAHRLFDARWLSSPQVRFELTGIANRIDLKHRGGCGEVHFVYRLAYTTYSKPGNTASRIDSRLPMTLNLLAPLPDDGQGCATTASKWLTLRSAPDVAAAAAAGPLAGLVVNRLETNFQLVRWPATVRRDMGGHAEYALRAFSLDPSGLKPIPLDDTPRTNLSAEEKAELREWIKGNLAAIDQGTATVPTKFLAQETVSVAPRAAARLGNKPFSALFRESDLSDLPLAGTERVRSAGALLHRLDGMTCNGCHQSRGIAGFHLLGEERVGTARLNALAVGGSAHLMEIVPWRKQFLEATSKRGQPFGRPHADRPNELVAGTYGSHCTLGKDVGFAGWACAPGLFCKDVNDDTLGHCLAGEKAPAIGDACEASRITQTLDPMLDRLTGRDLACGGGANCSSAHGDVDKLNGGFPDGTCRQNCTNLGDLSADKTVICGGVPSGGGRFGGINKCLFELKMPFTVCLEDDARPSLIRACGQKAPCRDDYVCARVLPRGRDGKELEEKDATMGACMPPYFVFQGRVDGHVLYE